MIVANSGIAPPFATKNNNNNKNNHNHNHNKTNTNTNIDVGNFIVERKIMSNRNIVGQQQHQINPNTGCSIGLIVVCYLF